MPTQLNQLQLERGSNVLSKRQLVTMLKLLLKMGSDNGPPFLGGVYPGNATEPNMSQLRIRVVEIWVTVLSRALFKYQGNVELAADLIKSGGINDEHVIFGGKLYRFAVLSLPSKVTLLCNLSASNRHHLGLFGAVLDDLGCSWDDLYRHYVGRYILHQFRLDHGFAEGNYVGVWDGLPDYTYVEMIGEQLDIESGSFPEELYLSLEQRYDSLVFANPKSPEL